MDHDLGPDILESSPYSSPVADVRGEQRHSGKIEQFRNAVNASRICEAVEQSKPTASLS